MKNISDLEILEKIKTGEKELFKVLIKKYHKLVYTTIYGFVLDKQTAEDLTQDVFIKLWENIYTLELKAKLSTWLYRVAANHAINFQKKKKFTTLFSQISKKIQDNTEDQTLEFDFGDDSQNIINNLENKELLKILKKEISKLPKRQKIAFVLNKFQGLSYNDIAEVMETSYSAVDALINRAKKNLTQKLLKYQNYEL